jgi:hypothetical protein
MAQQQTNKNPRKTRTQSQTRYGSRNNHNNQQAFSSNNSTAERAASEAMVRHIMAALMAQE